MWMYAMLGAIRIVDVRWVDFNVRDVAVFAGDSTSAMFLRTAGVLTSDVPRGALQTHPVEQILPRVAFHRRQ